MEGSTVQQSRVCGHLSGSLQSRAFGDRAYIGVTLRRQDEPVVQVWYLSPLQEPSPGLVERLAQGCMRGDPVCADVVYHDSAEPQAGAFPPVEATAFYFDVA